VNDILQRTPQSVDQVTIEPDGKWSQNALPTSPGQTNGSAVQNGDDDDDDIIEIKDIRLASLKSEYTSTPASGPKTPSANSREPSASRSSSNKRPVIDLTISDDEDEPPRPAKRTMTSNAFPNMLERRNGYRALNGTSRLNGLSFHMPSGNSRSNPSSVGTPDR
jgi:E3 SUMO-protein ligase PIAS1